jgi:hypothetical protein
MAGLLFEEWAHTQLSKAGNHIMQLLSNRTVTRTLSIPSLLAIQMFDDHELETKISNFHGSGHQMLYLRPKNQRFKAVDSFLLPETLFQITVSKRKACPDIESIISRLQKGGKAANIVMVYVVPAAHVPSFSVGTYTGQPNGQVKQFVLGLDIRQ